MKVKSKKKKVYFGQDEHSASSHGKNKGKQKERVKDPSRKFEKSTEFEEDELLLDNDGHPFLEDEGGDYQGQAGNGEFSAKYIYSILKKSSQPLRLDDILRRSSLSRRSKKEVLNMLHELVEQGKVVKQRGGSYMVSKDLKNLTGTLAIQRSGAAFVIPLKEDGSAGVPSKKGEDVYIPKHEILDAWNGDVVEVALLPKTKSYRGQSVRREGKIIQVVKRGQEEFTVRLVEEAPKQMLKHLQKFAEANSVVNGFLGQPMDARYPFMALVPALDLEEDQELQAKKEEQKGKTPSKMTRMTEGDLVIVRVLNPLPASRNKNHTETPLWLANPLRKLGEQDRVSVQEEITKLGNNVPTHFPDDVMAEAQELAQKEGFFYTDKDGEGLTNTVRLELGPHDTDLRDFPFVTMDGADSKDFDDAIYIEKNDKGYRLMVAIADVARYVEPFSALDKEARLRGNSYYFPNSVEPMLPEAISNGLCSLRPAEDHRVMFADMYFDHKGLRYKNSFGQGIIHSKARLTYEAVQEFYDKGEAKDAPFAKNLTPDLYEMLLDAKELSEMLIIKRRKAGSLHLEIPEPVGVIKDNKIVGLTTRSHFFAHELIEAFMVSANEAVAEFLSSRNAACLYRVHPEPAPERLESLKVVLQGTSIAEILPSKGADKIGAAAWICEILDSLENLKSQESAKDADVSVEDDNDALPKTNNSYLAHRMVLRSMMQARYNPILDGHFGLASQCYCHFTSPIRRYSDLLVHRSLKAQLGVSPKNQKIFSEDALNQTADLCNECERRALGAEREIYKRLGCLLLESEVGNEFDAIISGLTPFGLFAEMTANMAEGMIRMESLGDDYYIYDEETQSLYGERTKTIYRLGDYIRVVVTDVDISRLEINLGIVGVKPRNKGGNVGFGKGRGENSRGGDFKRGRGGDRDGRGSSGGYRGNKDKRGSRDGRDGHDRRDFRDFNDSRDNRDFRDSRDNRDNRDNRDRRDSRDTRDNKGGKYGKKSQDSKRGYKGKSEQEFKHKYKAKHKRKK